MVKKTSRHIILICIVVFFAAAGGAGSLALTSPRVSARAARYFLNRNWQGGKVDSVTIARQRWQAYRDFELADARVRLRYAKDVHELVIGRLAFRGLVPFILGKDELEIEVKDSEWRSGQKRARGMTSTMKAEFLNRRFQRLNSEFKVSSLEVPPLMINDIKGSLAATDESLSAFPLTGGVYDGKFNARIFMEYKPGRPYSMDIILEEADLKQVGWLDGTFLKGAEGRCNARVNIQGVGEEIRFMEADVNVVQKARVPAGLFKLIARYIPPSRERKRLELLMKKDGLVPLEKATLRMKSAGERSLSGEAVLSSRQLNLNITIPVDIRMDGDLSSLVRHYWKDVFEEILNQQMR